MNDVTINKIQSIQRCVRRAREEYEADPDGFSSNYTRQDAAILNVMRACETAIDLANYVIRARRMGVPVSSADSFSLLCAGGIIDAAMAERMERMVGFRYIIIHQYTEVDICVVEAVITSELDELLAFASAIREQGIGAIQRGISW